jgi:hypothetical protein
MGMVKGPGSPSSGGPEVLRNDNSLELYHGSRLVFASMGKWLHPLLDLERALSGIAMPAAELHLVDKIVGRAAALLIVRLGIRSVHALLLSRLGKEIFEKRGVHVSWEHLVDRIDCATEELLKSVDDEEEAHALIAERAADSRTRAGRSPQ